MERFISFGGYFAMPRQYGDGFMILGDSAGYLNGARLKGIHLAMRSGMLAAETAFEAISADDTSAARLQRFEQWIETQTRHIKAPVFKPFLKPLERIVLIAQTRINIRDIASVRLFVFEPPFKVFDDCAGFISSAESAEDVGELGESGI